MRKKMRNAIHNISTTNLKWWVVMNRQKNNLSCELKLEPKDCGCILSGRLGKNYERSIFHF